MRYSSQPSFRKKKSISLWVRIFLTIYIAVIVTSSIIAIRILSISSSAMMEREYDRAVSEHHMISQSMISFAETISNSLQGTYKVEQKTIVSALRNYANYYMSNKSFIVVLDDKDSTIYSNTEDNIKRTDLSVLAGEPRKYVYQKIGDKHYIFVNGTIKIDGDIYKIQFIHDITKAITEEQSMIKQVCIFIFIVLFLLGIIIFIFLNRAFKPLDQLSRQARAIAEENYHQRAEVIRMDEVGELATEFNHMANAVEMQINELKQASNSRDKLVANLAHELKTPLTAIMGYADLSLSNRMSPEAHAEAMHFIKKESKRLDGLSQKLLSLYSIVEGDKIVPKNILVAELIWQVKENVEPILDGMNQKLLINTNIEKCFVDLSLFVSLLVNLITNASKASESGKEIHISITKKNEATVFVVKDFGIGIDKENLAHVKDPFFMVDKSRTHSKRNSGLGLTLCEAIANAHGGRLEIESVKGKGTSVTVMIPSEK